MVDPEGDGKLNDVRHQRGYTYEDEVSDYFNHFMFISILLPFFEQTTFSQECLPNFAVVMDGFYREHLHAYEEILFIMDGRGFFDVRE